MTDRELEILAVTAGGPFDPGTWSGVSRWFLESLRRRGVLQGAVDARVRVARDMQAAGSWGPNKERWRQRYWAESSPLSGVARSLMSAAGTRRARQINSTPDVLLSLGAWFDARPGLRPRLRCSYSDMHIPLYLTRPDTAIDISSRAVRSAIDRERRTFDDIDVIFTMSEWLRQSIIADAGQDPDKVVTVGVGANIEIPEAATSRPLERPRYLFVGMRFERKGGPHLLDAFDIVRRERPDAELWIVGPPEPLAERDGVHWLGRIDRSVATGEAELRRLYTEATAFVMPSVFEPAGIVFLEAMSYALPCIGSDCCAMPEFITHGESGLLARRGDPEDLAAQMLATAARPGDARDMGIVGYRRLSEHFTWDHVAGRVIDVIQQRLQL